MKKKDVFNQRYSSNVPQVIENLRWHYEVFFSMSAAMFKKKKSQDNALNIFIRFRVMALKIYFSSTNVL